MTLKLAIPNKGRLSERSVQILKQAGLEIEDADERKLYANVKRRTSRSCSCGPRTSSRFVHKGAVDVGVTGKDLVLESGLDVMTVYELNFGHCRLSVAAPEASGVDSVEDVKDGTVVATSFPNMTQKYFEKLGKKVEITTISPERRRSPRTWAWPTSSSDLVSSGSTLKMNHLKEIAVIADSQAVVIANHKAYESHERGDRRAGLGHASVMDAENKKYLMADVPKASLDEVQEVLPRHRRTDHHEHHRPRRRRGRPCGHRQGHRSTTPSSA